MTLVWLPIEIDSMAEAALMYARNGWPVFPCQGKRPITQDGFKGATIDQEAISRTWAGNPGANIGWPLRASWFALDVDPRHGGDKSLRDLERQHGPLPNTLRAITGSGGEHWIFRVPDGVEIRQLAGFREGLDTRVGGRGYLLVAPSVHPETGKGYRWMTSIDPVDPPAWLVEIVKAPSVPPRAPYKPPTATREMDRRRRYALAALRGCADEVREAGKGQRNDTLNRAWFRMAQLRDAVSRDEAQVALLEAALQVGLPEKEALAVMR